MALSMGVVIVMGVSPGINPVCVMLPWLQNVVLLWLQSVVLLWLRCSSDKCESMSALSLGSLSCTNLKMDSICC